MDSEFKYRGRRAPRIPMFSQKQATKTSSPLNEHLGLPALTFYNTPWRTVGENNQIYNTQSWDEKRAICLT